MKLLNISVCLLAALLTGCAASKTEEGLANFSSLNGKIFRLTVSKTAKQPKVASPMEELKESDYIAVADGKSYTVSFQADGTKVTLEPGTLRGEKIATSDNSVCYYTLTDGVFAGGRFLVRIKQSGYEAELTIYGSGLPIILSERGSLLPGN